VGTPLKIAFNQAFLKKFFSEKGAWETRPINKSSEAGHFESKSLAI